MNRHSNWQRGFTLIEIMIVIMIIGGVVAVGGTRLFNPNENRRGLVRKVAIRSKEIRTQARLQNATFRLVIDMDDEKGHRFWVESASGHVMQISEADEKELGKLTEIQRQSALGKRAKFERDPKYGDEVKLTSGLVFEGVDIAGRQKEITQGLAYVHFFPQGLSDEAVIRLGDRQNQHWSIAIHPLTGHAEIIQRSVSLKELKGQ